jgi:hypothetical protein
MAIQIGEQPERVSRLEKWAPWIRRVLIIGCLIWAAFSIQNFSEDEISHTIKASYPLLMGYERIVSRTPDFDPAKARWKAVETAVPVIDDQIVFIRTGGAVYAVQISGQTAHPERAQYAYLQAGGSAPVVHAGTGEFPDSIELPGCKIGWSGRANGQGFIYLDDAFIWGKPSRFEVGVPFQKGALEKYRKTVPTEVHFETVPWKVKSADNEEMIPAQ